MGLRCRTSFAIAREICVNWHTPGIAERGPKEMKEKEETPLDRRTRAEGCGKGKGRGRDGGSKTRRYNKQASKTRASWSEIELLGQWLLMGRVKAR